MDADSAPSLMALEERRLGGIHDTELEFTFITDAARGDDGTVYVLDRGDLRIRAIGPSGELVRTIGRRGPGPGEFRSAPRIGVTGETIWAIEKRRLTIFKTDGALVSAREYNGGLVTLQGGSWAVGDLPIREVGFDGLVVPFAMRTDSLFTSHLIYTERLFSTQRPTLGDSVTIPVLLFDMFGAIADTVGFYAEPPRKPVVISAVKLEGRAYMLPQPPPDLPLRIPALDGRYVVDRPTSSSQGCATFHVTKFDWNGTRVFRREFSYTPRGYSLENLQARAALGAGRPGWAHLRFEHGQEMFIALGPSVDGGSDYNEVRDRVTPQIRSRMQFPEVQPPVQDYFLGKGGELWLAREVEPAAPRLWLVFDTDGMIRGKVTIPAGNRLVWVGESAFWTVDRDELGVESLVQYRIIGG